MIKQLFCTIVLVSLGLFVNAQHTRGGGATGINKNYDQNNLTDSTDRTEHKTYTPNVAKPARDFVMLQFNYYNWLTKPDSVKTKPFGYSFNSYICYDFPIKKSNFSFATGVGVNVNVTYLDQLQLAVSDTGAKGNAARFVADTSHFTRYKFVTTYLTAPFEIRYFSNMQNRNKGFKAAAGLQIGTLLGAHTKAVETVGGTKEILKLDTKRYLSPWSFAAIARVGYGNITLFGAYNLTNVFKENSGPPITPITLGICLTGL